MGLDTTHGCWNGAYSSFNAFRHFLAEKININLDEYHGYGSDNASKFLEDIDHDIMPLLNHSDCDGYLSVQECERIANGLEQILKENNWMNIDESTIYDRFSNADLYYAQKAKDFMDGCRFAVEKNENVEFH